MRYEKPFFAKEDTVPPCGYLSIAADPKQLISKYKKNKVQSILIYQLIKDRISIIAHLLGPESLINGDVYWRTKYYNSIAKFGFSYLKAKERA